MAKQKKMNKKKSVNEVMNKKAKKIGQDQGPENKKNPEKGNFLN